MRIGIAIVLAGAVAGCSDAKYLNGPEAFDWKEWGGAHQFSVKQKPSMKGEFSHHGGRLRASVWGFPKGTELQLGDDKATVEGEQGSASVSVDVTDRFAKMPASILAQASSFGGQRPVLQHGLSLVITPKGKAPVALKLPEIQLFDLDISGLFEGAPEHGGYVFKGEQKKAPEKHKSVIAVSPFVRGVVGNAETLADIDAVAVTKTLPEVKGKKECGGFADSNGRPMAPVTLELKDTEVTLYDRRTGAELEKRRFPPLEECPTTVLLRGSARATDSRPPEKDILAWLKAWTDGVRPTTAEVAPVAAPAN